MLIKYTKEKYVDLMLNHGRVRLSTYWHFKAHEQAEIGDPEEGQSGYLFQNNTTEPWVIEPQTLDAASMSQQNKVRFTESKTLNPGEESWIEAVGGFNTYMFSLTQAETPSRQLMSRLGYNCAIEVIDINSFIKHTGKALHAYLIKECGIDKLGVGQCRCISAPVKYIESKRKIVTPKTVNIVHKNNPVSMDDFFTKTLSFKYQSEFRIAYFFRNPATTKFLSLETYFSNLEPVIIGDGKEPSISKTFRLIHNSEYEN